MEMHQVRYFLAVSRTLNFTRAAEECHVAQPSLTRAIKQLEEELGAELFRRERNLSHLTEFGQRMLPLLQQCYDSAASAKALATSFKTGEVAPLSIALSTAVDFAFGTRPHRADAGVQGARVAVPARHPRSGPRALKKGEAELAIAGPSARELGPLDAWPLFTEHLRLAVSSGASACRPGYCRARRS